MKKKSTATHVRSSIQKMQREFDAIKVEEDVEEMLDRLLNRIGVLYEGNYRAYFDQLESTSGVTKQEALDARVIEQLRRAASD